MALVGVTSSTARCLRWPGGALARLQVLPQEWGHGAVQWFGVWSSVTPSG